MKKLNVILHETTIIDFPFFWKLILRYKWVSLLIPLFVFSYSTYYYQGQNDIYQRRKSFKNLNAESNSSTSAIASVLGEKTSTLSDSEIVGMINSLDFQQEFAQYILKHPELPNLNLGTLKDKSSFKMGDFFSPCGSSENCKLDLLRGRIFSFTHVIPDMIVANKYLLEVSSKDPYTTKFLLEEISKKIVQSRVDTIKHKIDEQIKLSKELAFSKRDKIDSFNLKKMKTEKRKLESGIEELHRKITDYNRHYQKLKLDLALVETQVNETKKASSGKIETDKLLVVEKRKALEEKIKKYEQDISAIRSLNSNLSASDSEIVAQLNKQLENAKTQLKKSVKVGREVSSSTQFILKKEGESRFTEFNFRVLKEQVKKAKSDYEALIIDREAKSKKLAIVDAKIEEIKPAFEYLRLLDQKIVQLDFFNSTVVSDLKFENQLSPLKRYKKTSRTKVYMFSGVVSFVTLLLIIITLYLLDDRIFDQTELQKSFEDLTIIGNTPDFD